MGQKFYVVTLGEKILAQTKAAVRADSEEDAARLALEGARYGMQSLEECEWEIYEFDTSVDTTIYEVETATREDAECALQTHLLNGARNETHERIISKWKEVWGRS